MSTRNLENRVRNEGHDVKSRGSMVRALSSDGEGIELDEIVAVLRGGKWTIATAAIVLLVLATLYAFLAPAIYQSNGLIQIQQQNLPGEGSGSTSDVLSLLVPMPEPAQAEIAIMTSRAVLEPVIRNMHLDVVVEKSDFPIVGHLFSDRYYSKVRITRLNVPDGWKDEDLTITNDGGGDYVLKSPSGSSVLKGTVGKLEVSDKDQVSIQVETLAIPKGSSVQVTRLFDQEVIEDLQKNIGATELGKDTGIVQLTYNNHHRHAAKKVLDEIERQYIRQNVAAMSSQAEKSIVFIEKELPQLKKKLDHAESELTSFMQKNGAIDLDKQSTALLSGLTDLEEQVAQIKVSEAALRQRYTTRFVGYKALRSQEKSLNRQISDIRAQIGSLPRKAQTYMGLTQETQVYQQLYSALLGKVQDLKITKAGTVGNARVIDQGDLPIKPISPRKFLIMAVGLALGLFVGILMVFVRRAIAQPIEDASILERQFNLPVYGVIPHSYKQEALIRKAEKTGSQRIPLLLTEDPADPVVESIRSMKASLTFLMADKDIKIISIGGCAPGAGKSFISMNLAHVVGATNVRTLLIDADMRRGRLEKHMNGVKSPGLSEILEGKANFSEVIQRSPHGQNVDFIPSGARPANPFELLSRSELSVLLDQCSKDYDLVIIDVPPILSVADGAIIARLTTTNFLVVRSGYQHMKEVRMALDRFEQNGAHVVGFILNDLSAQAQSYTYGKYGGAYKRYRYDNPSD